MVQVLGWEPCCRKKHRDDEVPNNRIARRRVECLTGKRKIRGRKGRRGKENMMIKRKRTRRGRLKVATMKPAVVLTTTLRLCDPVIGRWRLPHQKYQLSVQGAIG